MRQLSLWGKHHPHSARFLIFFTHLFIGFGGAELGLWLYAQGIQLPAVVFFLLLTVFLTAYVLYPIRQRLGASTQKDHSGYNLSSYARRKWLDGILLCSMALMWLAAGNRMPERFLIPASVIGQATITMPTAQSTLSLEESSKTSGFIKKSKHKMGLAQKWFGHRIEKRLNQYADNSGGDVALIILLGLLLSFVLIYLTLAVACSLSCSGNDVAAVLALILGLGLIVMMWILFAKWIRRRRKVGVW